MSEIFIVVHANSTWNELGLWQGQCDTPLSTTGRDMANRLMNSEHLTTVKKIISSDLKRAYQTVQPLAKKLKLNINMEPGLREGRWPDHHRRADAPLLSAPYPYESREQLKQRAITTLDDIVENNIQLPLLVITHGTFLECFIESIRTNRDSEYKGIRTSVNSFNYVNKKWNIQRLNEVSHLPEVTDNMICVTNKVN